LRPSDKKIIDLLIDDVPAVVEILKTHLQDLERELGSGIKHTPETIPFTNIGWILSTLQALEEHGYDAQRFEKNREEAFNLVRGFIDRWDERFLNRVKEGLTYTSTKYKDWIQSNEEMIDEGVLSETGFSNIYDISLGFRVTIENLILGIKALSYSSVTELAKFEESIRETDERLRRILPEIAKTFADVLDAFAGRPADPRLYPKSFWWIHETAKLHREYRSKLPPGTPDRGVWHSRPA